MHEPFLTRVTIRNYKSIAACKVDLSQLMFLVGPNGSGKSNFLDAIRFVADALRTSLDHALRDRGTIKEVRRRSGGHPGLPLSAFNKLACVWMARVASLATIALSCIGIIRKIPLLLAISSIPLLFLFLSRDLLRRYRLCCDGKSISC